MAEHGRYADLWDRPIVLHDATWHDHILTDHPEMMVGDELAIEQVVEDPDYVTQDIAYDNGQNYYRRGVLSGSYDSHFLKVCVRFERPNVAGERVGIIVTAYPTFTVKRTEKVRWSRTTSR